MDETKNNSKNIKQPKEQTRHEENEKKIATEELTGAIKL